MIVRGLAYQRLVQKSVPMTLRPMIGWNLRLRRLMALGLLWMLSTPSPQKQVTTRKRRGL